MSKIKVCFILSGNLSTTPRAVKQINCLKNKGFNVTVYSVNRGAGWSLLDKDILRNINVDTFYNFDLNDRNLLWARAKCIFFLSNFLLKLKFTNLPLLTYSSNISDYLLVNGLKKDTIDYDLIIGYTISMYSSLFIAKNKKIPFIFDVEDFHPGISSNENINKLEAKIMFSCLSASNFVTYASPLIGEKVKALLGDKMPSSLLINNNFPSSEFSIPQTQTDKIRFVWFSQTISFKRGLELIISALKNFKDSVELILIGNLDKTFEQEWIVSNKSFISIIPTISQQELHNYLANFDVGLALESNTSDFNRQICLTNKIWAYLQAGLYILATNTPAQVNFINEYQKHGILIEQTMESTIIGLQHIISNIKEIRQKAQQRYELAKMYSWDYEQKKWLSAIEQLLKP